MNTSANNKFFIELRYPKVRLESNVIKQAPKSKISRLNSDNVDVKEYVAGNYLKVIIPSDNRVCGISEIIPPDHLSDYQKKHHDWSERYIPDIRKLHLEFRSEDYVLSPNKNNNQINEIFKNGEKSEKYVGLKAQLSSLEESLIMTIDPIKKAEISGLIAEIKEKIKSIN